MKTSNSALIQALNKMLSIAKYRLEIATTKGRQWDVDHYANDINIINKQLTNI